MCKQTSQRINTDKTHLTGTTVHWPQIFSKFLSDGKIHVEVLEGGDGADLHGSCGWIMGDLFGGLQQTNYLPQSKVNICEERRMSLVGNLIIRGLTHTHTPFEGGHGCVCVCVCCGKRESGVI